MDQFDLLIVKKMYQSLLIKKRKGSNLLFIHHTNHNSTREMDLMGDLLKTLSAVSMVFLLMTLSFAALEGEADPGDAGSSVLPPVSTDIIGSYGFGYFTENLGQWDDDILFAGRTHYGSIYICRDGIYHNILGDGIRNFIRISFQGNSFLSPSGLYEKEFYSNYLTGNDPENWAVRARSFGEVLMEEVWRGIDIRYHYGETGLKYDLILEKGCDPAEIKFKVDGPADTHIEDDGVVIDLPGGEALKDDHPVAWDEHGIEVPVEFIELGSNVFGFDIDMRESETVTIDPLIYSTFLGGTNEDRSTDIALDPDGNILIYGYTMSLDFPVTIGSFVYSGNFMLDLVVSKFDPTGRKMIYSTALGGMNFDFSSALDVDENGDIYMTGQTASVDLPVTPGVIQNRTMDRHPGYYWDIFLMKLGSNGTMLHYCTYIGGDWYEKAYDLTVKDGNVYLCGWMESHNFPTHIGRIGGVHGSAFFLMLNHNASRIISSALWDGSGSESATKVKVRDDGDVIIGGSTNSPGFPITQGSFNQFPATWTNNVFISRINTSTNLIFFTSVIGGTSGDSLTSLDLDMNGDIYFTGSSYGGGIGVPHHR